MTPFSHATRCANVRSRRRYMKIRLVLFAILLVGGILVAMGWHRTHHGAVPESILARSALATSRFDYSWTGGFSFGNSAVRASFSGDGRATLRVGDDEPIRVQIAEARYRDLLQTLATNSFEKIRVRRRWGLYLHDIGKYELVLTDGRRRTVVYADEKHYIAQPHLLDPILEKVYSFETEFGARFDHGPVGVAGSSDKREILIGMAVGAGCVTALIVAALYTRRRKRRNAEPRTAPKDGTATRLGDSGVPEGPPSVS